MARPLRILEKSGSYMTSVRCGCRGVFTSFPVVGSQRTSCFYPTSKALCLVETIRRTDLHFVSYVECGLHST